METDCKYLFIYGTLLDADNQFGAYLRNHSNHSAYGYFNGLLYDIGEYPGAVYNTALAQKVYGEIRLLSHPAKALKIIDAYEGYGPEEEQPNLFIRRIIIAYTPTGPLTCWAYIYNLSTKAYKQILSGRYRA